MALREGQTFAGYRIVRLLGSGGMGEVYLAQHPRLPRQDALKVLPADVSADPDYRARFNREADLASKLWHPHIVSVHDRGEHHGQLWISMDYVDGLDAGRLLASRYPEGMPADEVVRIVTAVASALDYAHKQGLLHRDVKPANIMLSHLDDDDDEQRILLADFGIARSVDDISGLTATNMTVGTVAYAAPEQLMGEEIDGRADQYALAATAYHLLTGSHLFPNSNPVAVISRHLNSSPPALAVTRPDLATFDPVLAVALAKDPNSRFPRCADFARVLEQAASPRSASVTATTAPAPASDRPNQRGSVSGPPRRWLIPATLLAVSILIAAVALTWQQWHQGHVTTATSSAATPPHGISTSSAPEAPPPAGAPPSAAPSATKVITVVAVVNGQAANGYREVSSPGNAQQAVFGCSASPAAVHLGIYKCYPSVANADICWPSTPGTLLCLDNPWDKRLYRKLYTDMLPPATKPSAPEPFALLLDDGTQCRLRNGGAWTVRNDGYLGAYGCPDEKPAVLIAAPGAEPVDRSQPLWTVKIGPLGFENFPAPQTHAVTTAWFAGN
ncbi:serine/threonine-protein kinase [Mycobacterium sp. Z3061]|uniref:serine/threonine-protein kinase n=1 Tax=Mycobacterium sp. Z3061 TaxID=3073562 RepID=UPI002872E7AB|nr:serine/threonine-protein kinase [Mycobacterium sp. Z3061]